MILRSSLTHLIFRKQPSTIQFHSSPGGRGSGFTIAFGSSSKSTPNFSVALDLSRKRSRGENNNNEQVEQGASNSTRQPFTLSENQDQSSNSSWKRPRLEHQIQRSTTDPPSAAQQSDAIARFDAAQNTATTNTTTKPKTGAPLRRTYSIHNLADCDGDPWELEKCPNPHAYQVSSSPPQLPARPPTSFTPPNLFDFLWGANSAKASAKARELVGMPTRNSIIRRGMRAPLALAGRRQDLAQAPQKIPNHQNQGRDSSGKIQNVLRRTLSTVHPSAGQEDRHPGQKQSMVEGSMVIRPPDLSLLPKRTRLEEENGEEERPSKRSRGTPATERRMEEQVEGEKKK